MTILILHLQEKLGYTAAICSNLTQADYSEEQELVQRHVSDYEGLYSSLSFAPK